MNNKFLQLDNPIEKTQDDYFQSANSLFHFMKEQKFLHASLFNKALIPRYCCEDVSYLNINNSEGTFKEIAIAQKCFCDIPLHNISSRFKDYSKENNINPFLSPSHTDFYGEFAIAFSKHWGEMNNLQPIQYINENSFYCKNLSDYINRALNAKDLSQECVDDVLIRLSLIKPLRGKMQRLVDGKQVLVSKNFHDEQEWRYILFHKKVQEHNINSEFSITPIIANPQQIKSSDFINLQSSLIEEKTYKDLWLKFEYDDIKYIIVPNKQTRLDCITYILSLSDEQFNSTDKMVDKSILISKILILDEI